MNHVKAFLVMAALAAPLLAGCQRQQPAPRPVTTPPPPPPTEEGELSMEFTLESTAFEHNGDIPAKYSRSDGEDASPPLSWTDPPEGTQELALICDDPDAPMGTWVHWVIYGLTPELRSLPQGVPTDETVADLGTPKQGTNGWGEIGYGGPAPPSGTHHYSFRLYALDAPTGLEAGATKEDLLAAMEGHILAQAELVGLYSAR